MVGIGGVAIRETTGLLRVNGRRRHEQTTKKWRPNENKQEKHNDENERTSQSLSPWQ